MTGFLPLLKLQLISRYADLKPRNLKTAMKEKKGKTIGMAFAILFLIVYLGAILFIVEQKMLDVLVPSGMAYLLITMAVVLATAGTLVMAFFFIMSSLYLGRDNTFIAALPIKPRTVLSARLLQVWISETLIDAVILLPACIQYGIRLGVGADFYLRMVLVWLLVSVLPICIVTFISALLIRLSALWKKRELIMTVGGFIFFVLYMILMMNLGAITGDSADGGEMVQQLVMNNSEMIKNVSTMFPPAQWAVEGMLGDWGQLALYVAVSLAAAGITVWLMGYPYRKLSLLQSETPESRSKKGIKAGSFQGSSAFKACVKREFLQIIRVPSYATNTLPIAFMPLLMVIMMGVMIGRNMGDNGETLQTVFQQLNPALVMAIIAAVMAYMSGMNPALSTSVTREGKGHGFLIGLPISPRTLIRAKFTVGYGLSLIGVICAGIALAIMFPASLLPVLLALVLCLVFAYMGAMLALSRDVKKPKLDWVTEQEAVKQNFGVLISMLISWAVLALLAIITYFMIDAGWGLWPVFGALAGILAILCFLTRKLMYNNVDKYYCKA